MAKGYPFGNLKDYEECIVRDPIEVGGNGELICVGEVPENSVLEVLKGNPASLISAAGEAATDCLEVKGKEIAGAFLFDCISRVLFLEDDFPLELKEVQN